MTYSDWMKERKKKEQPTSVPPLFYGESKPAKTIQLKTDSDEMLSPKQSYFDWMKQRKENEQQANWFAPVYTGPTPEKNLLPWIINDETPSPKIVPFDQQKPIIGNSTAETRYSESVHGATIDSVLPFEKTSAKKSYADWIREYKSPDKSLQNWAQSTIDLTNDIQAYYQEWRSAEDGEQAYIRYREKIKSLRELEQHWRALYSENNEILEYIDLIADTLLNADDYVSDHYDYYSSFDSKDSMEKHHANWLTSNADDTASLAAQRQLIFEANKARVAEIEELLKNELSKEQKEQLKEEKEKLENENLQYSTSQGIADSYVHLTEEEDFEEVSAKRDFINPTRERMDNDDARESGWYTTANGDLYNGAGEKVAGRDENGNFGILNDSFGLRPSSGGLFGTFKGMGEEYYLIDRAKVNDPLGLFLSTSEDERLDAFGSYTSGSWVELIRTGQNNHWEQINSDETALYYYILNKQGNEAAMKYLGDMAEIWNARWGTNEAQRIQGIDNDLAKALAMGINGIQVGMDNWGMGLKKALTNENVPTTGLQYSGAVIADSLDGWGKHAYQATTTIGNMLPSIAISYMLPGGIGNVVGAAAQGLSSSGHAYDQARKEGYSEVQARTYGTLIGASEATLQYLLGGIGKLSGGSGKIVSKLAMIDNSLLRISAKLGINIAKEIGEEELQLFLEPAFRMILFGEDYDAPSIDEIMDTAIVTAMSTLVLEGGDTISGDARMTKSGKAVKDAGLEDALISFASTLPKGTEAQVLAEYLQKKGTANPTQVGELMAAVNKQAGTMSNAELHVKVEEALGANRPVAAQEAPLRITATDASNQQTNVNADPQTTTPSLTFEEQRMQELVKISEIASRILARRRALENAPPEFVPVLESLMVELDTIRVRNKLTDNRQSNISSQATAPRQPIESDGTHAKNTDLLPVDEHGEKAYNQHRRMPDNEQDALFDQITPDKDQTALTQAIQDQSRPYKVFHEASVGETKSRSSHRNRANKEFYTRLEQNTDFRNQMNELLGYDVMAYMKTGKGALKNPSPELVWHHPIDKKNIVELMYKKDHQDPELQKHLHYMPRGAGGFSINF